MNAIKLFFVLLCSHVALGNTVMEWERLKKDINEQQGVINYQLLGRILYMFHNNEKINERDNTKNIHRTKEMYVAQCVKRISQNMKAASTD